METLIALENMNKIAEDSPQPGTSEATEASPTPRKINRRFFDVAVERATSIIILIYFNLI
jgi:hypothetical protein